MQGKYPFSKTGYYPHMKPADIILWEKFILAFPGFFNSCDYDVLVGTGVVVGNPDTDPYSKSFQMLTQKKIDVVGYKDDKIVIIEVKPRAGSNAMGQVLSYKEMWSKDHPEVPVENIYMGVVTDEPQSDFASIYETAGIALYPVGF